MIWLLAVTRLLDTSSGIYRGRLCSEDHHEKFFDECLVQSILGDGVVENGIVYGSSEMQLFPRARCHVAREDDGEGEKMSGLFET